MENNVAHRLESILSDVAVNSSFIILDTSVLTSSLNRRLSDFSNHWNLREIIRLTKRSDILKEVISQKGFYICSNTKNELLDGIEILDYKLTKLQNKFQEYDFTLIENAINSQIDIIDSIEVLNLPEIFNGRGNSWKFIDRDMHKIAKNVMKKVPLKRGKLPSYVDINQVLVALHIARHTHNLAINVSKDYDFFNTASSFFRINGYKRRFGDFLNYKLAILPMGTRKIDYFKPYEEYLKVS